MKSVYSYQSPPNGWHQELMVMMMMKSRRRRRRRKRRRRIFVPRVTKN